MVDEPVALKVLLRERHWTYSTFCAEYAKAARTVDSRLTRTWPSRAQFHRWLAGDLRQLPHPDACRVLEALFPGWTVEQLFGRHRGHRSDRPAVGPAVSHTLRGGGDGELPAGQFQDVTAIYA